MRHKEHKCPTCGHIFDTTQPPDALQIGTPIEPKTGDIAVCFKCASVLIVDDPYRNISIEELSMLSIDERKEIQNVIDILERWKSEAKEPQPGERRH